MLRSSRIAIWIGLPTLILSGSIWFLISFYQSHQNPNGGLSLNFLPLPSSEEAFYDGRIQFHLRKCAECHGPAGQGGQTGTESALLQDYERPASLLNHAQAWGQPSLEEGILRMSDVLRYGPPPNPSLDPASALEHAYPFISDREVLHLIYYTTYLMGLTALPDPNSATYPEFSPQELEDLRQRLKNRRLSLAPSPTSK